MTIHKPTEASCQGRLPTNATLSLFQFTAQTLAEQTIVMEFAHPVPTKVVRVQYPEGLANPGRDAIEMLLLHASPKESPSSRGELHHWVVESAHSGSLPITITLHGAQVVWRPGRASILAPAERIDSLMQALLEFCHFENELRKLEEEIAAGWKDLEADTPLAYEITPDDFDRHEEIGQRMDQTLKRRIRLARIETPLYHSNPSFGTVALELGDRLREKAHIESRLETVDGQLEVFEYVYEMSSQRISEATAARKERTLEWLIIVLLATEVIMLLADLIWKLEA